MIVFAGTNQKTPLYRVSDSDLPARGAAKALREAFRIHRGNCFYCKQEIAPRNMTLDHVEPEALGGKDHLQNLVIAHKSCNIAKGHRPIEAYKAGAGREWLSALLLQVQDRLNRL